MWSSATGRPIDGCWRRDGLGERTDGWAAVAETAAEGLALWAASVMVLRAASAKAVSCEACSWGTSIYMVSTRADSFSSPNRDESLHHRPKMKPATAAAGMATSHEGMWKWRWRFHGLTRSASFSSSRSWRTMLMMSWLSVFILLQVSFDNVHGFVQARLHGAFRQLCDLRYLGYGELLFIMQ